MTKTAIKKLPLLIDSKRINEASSVFRAINHRLRLQILEITHKAGKININRIRKELCIEQSVLSVHIKMLKDAKVLYTEKKRNAVFYSINYIELDRISVLIQELIPFSSVSSNLVDSLDSNLIVKSKEKTAKFTSTELKVIHLICEENTNEEISEKLGLGKRMIEDQIRIIIRKMKVRNSVGILFYAIKAGIYRI